MAESKTIRLAITGMTCAACANTVGRSLSRLEGVQSVSVSPVTNEAELLVDRDIPASEIVAAVEASGYGAATMTADFPVLGMTCANCVRAVERAVSRLNGVVEVSVNLASERARVKFIPTMVGLDEIKQAVVGAGYTVPESTCPEATTNVESAQEREALRHRQRLRVALALAVPTALLSVPFSLHLVPDFPAREWILFLLASPAQIYVASPFYLGTYKALRNRAPNMDVLIVVGTTIAYLYSVLSLIWLKGPTHFETAVMIVTLVTIGKYLELRARRRASGALRELLSMQPQFANVLVDDHLEKRPVSSLSLGDEILVGAGERIPVDAIVIEGSSAVDESLLTGESTPVPKQPGDTVYGGTMNGLQLLRIRAASVGQDTMLAQIIRLVAEAQGSKASVQRLADRLAAIFVPVVLTLAVGTLVGWLLAGNRLDEAIMHAVAVVVVSCPCALGLATPAAIAAGTGRGAQLGILIRGGEVLEKAGRANTIVLDKTGTLTEGHPQVTEIWAANGKSPKEVLSYAAAAESVSRHPLAEAVIEAARERHVTIAAPDNYEEIPGRGVRANLGDHRVTVGSWSFLEEQGAPLILEHDVPTDARLFVTVDGSLVGALVVTDALRSNARETVDILKHLGLSVVVLTGDKLEVAQQIGAAVGADRVLAEVLPQGKVNEIRRLQSEGRVVAMVGDGINDAPALAQADLGIAVGGATAVAMEAADITLLSNDLLGVPRAILLSRRTLKGIKENLFWAFFYNVILIPAAMAGLLQPAWAAAAMAASSLLVVGNALRLQRWRPSV